MSGGFSQKDAKKGGSNGHINRISPLSTGLYPLLLKSLKNNFMAKKTAQGKGTADHFDALRRLVNSIISYE